jgi:hypothetical protein
VSLTLQQAAARAGGHCWVERRLFERLGGWVAPSTSASAKLLLDSHAQHAAWRAEQWWVRLPVLASIDREALVAPPGHWAAALSDLSTEGRDGARLALAYRVWLPRLAVAYDHHLAATTPVADASVARTLRQVLADIRADWAEGEAVLQELIVTSADVSGAAATVAAGEALLVG